MSSPNGSLVAPNLLLGDCLELFQDIPDESQALVIADPPYGIDYQSAWRSDKTQWKPKIANDQEPFLGWLLDAFRVTKAGGSLLCFCRWDVEETFRQAIGQVGYTVKSQVIWDKIVHGMGDLDGAFAPQHENIWFATKGDFSFPSERPHSIIRIPRIPAEQLVHPNEKPVALYRYLIRALTVEGDSVLDPFLGSGPSISASQQLGRQITGFEIDPKYYELCTQRASSTQLILF